ncbi:MAG: hypothetical protein KY466_15380 [Gemmatimonadetes bacterium]|nr:hypothetical protein [Gemmatimonadota bacterium]
MRPLRQLQVHRLTHTGTAPYPATARWGWDSGRGVHYIGIKCGAAWCALGPDGFRPRETTLGGGGVHEVPGWYDDQHLAIPDGNGGLVPGPWGKIEPARNLGALRVESFAAQPQIVAFVTLTGTREELAHYESTWNLRRGRNRLLLSNRPEGWFMTVEQDGGQPARFVVSRVTGAMHAVHGAVRWRWDSEDESTWIGCDDACCTPVR